MTNDCPPIKLNGDEFATFFCVFPKVELYPYIMKSAYPKTMSVHSAGYSLI